MPQNILIIEDDKDMCRELNEVFTDMNHRVHYVYDGISGKKMLKKNIYDVIILDLKIPDYDGYKILNLIRKKKEKIRSKIIVITARMKIHFEDIIKQNQEHEEDDLLKIADFILIKPFKITDLIDKINHI